MTDEAAAARLRAALDMYEFGVEMYRSRMRREHPDATDDAINEMVRSWLHDRPLDAPGRVSHRFDHLRDSAG